MLSGRMLCDFRSLQVVPVVRFLAAHLSALMGEAQEQESQTQQQKNRGEKKDKVIKPQRRFLNLAVSFSVHE